MNPSARQPVCQWDWLANDSITCKEVNAFDAVVESGGVPVLAMEAKARIAGADGLLELLSSLLRLGANPQAAATGNHWRKYAALLDMTASGPVVLWLVADGARWAFDANTVARTVRLTPRTTAGGPLIGC
jgi:hypothetical protein